jgi:hypothetical protein
MSVTTNEITRSQRRRPQYEQYSPQTIYLIQRRFYNILSYKFRVWISNSQCGSALSIHKNVSLSCLILNVLKKTLVTVTDSSSRKDSTYQEIISILNRKINFTSEECFTEMACMIMHSSRSNKFHVEHYNRVQVSFQCCPWKQMEHLYTTWCIYQTSDVGSICLDTAIFIFIHDVYKHRQMCTRINTWHEISRVWGCFKLWNPLANCAVRKGTAFDAITGVLTVVHFWIYQKSFRDDTGSSSRSTAVTDAGNFAVDNRILYQWMWLGFASGASL